MAERPAATHTQPVSAWLLAGGEGRRMGGLDKGLQPWRERPLADWVLQSLLPQVDQIGISANRNQATYELLLAKALLNGDRPLHDLGVRSDDADLPARSGPLAGILTGLRLSQTDWVQVASCDTPRLPAHLVSHLLDAAANANADIAVPLTREGADGAASTKAEERLHWTCALLHKRVTPELAAAFVKGERKVGQWIRTQRWVAVSFATASDFENMNSLETLDDRA